MPVRLDHAWHQRAPATVDHRGSVGLDRISRDGLDHVAFHEDVAIGNQRVAGAVEDAYIGEQHPVRLILCRSALIRKNQ